MGKSDEPELFKSSIMTLGDVSRNAGNGFT